MKPQIFDDQFIVITGAAGCIGSGVVRYLNDKGLFNLILVDDLHQGEKWKNLQNKRFAHFISRERLFDFLKGHKQEIEAFIHLGACSDITETDGDYLIRNNYQFSINLAEYALENEQRFIYASSASTYGDGSLGFSDNETHLHSLCPLNLHAFSKHMFDLWLQEQKALDQVLGLKYFNIFGPNEKHKGHMASMVMHMTDQIQKTGRVQIFQSTQSKRFKDEESRYDFLYVKDAVKMTCFLLDHDINGIFNLGSGSAHSWNEMAKIIFRTLGKKPHIEYLPLPKNLEEQYQHCTCADMFKLNNELKKKNQQCIPDFTFESAIEDYVNNHLIKNKGW